MELVALNQSFHCSTTYHHPHAVHKAFGWPVLGWISVSTVLSQGEGLLTLMIVLFHICYLCASAFLYSTNPIAKFPLGYFNVGLFVVYFFTSFFFFFRIQRDHACPYGPLQTFMTVLQNFITLCSSPLCTMCSSVENGRAELSFGIAFSGQSLQLCDAADTVDSC